MALLWILHGALFSLCVKADSLHWALHILVKIAELASLSAIEFHAYLHQMQFAQFVGVQRNFKNVSGLLGPCILISDLDLND